MYMYMYINILEVIKNVKNFGTVNDLGAYTSSAALLHSALHYQWDFS